MIDKLMPLVPAVEEATGHRPHLSTVLRWATNGRRGVRLQTWLVGGRRMTRPSAVNEFVEKLSEWEPVCDIPTPRQAERAAERSAKKLRERLSGRR